MIKSINLTVKYADIKYAGFDKFTTSEQPWCQKILYLLMMQYSNLQRDKIRWFCYFNDWNWWQERCFLTLAVDVCIFWAKSAAPFYTIRYRKFTMLLIFLLMRVWPFFFYLSLYIWSFINVLACLSHYIKISRPSASKFPSGLWPCPFDE